MNRRTISHWIPLLLLFGLLATSCAEVSPPTTEGNTCENSTDCAGLICDPVSNTCKKPDSDPDAGNNSHNDTGTNSDTGNNNDPGTNPDTGNNDTGPNPPPTSFSGCTDNSQCAGYQQCNVARGRCEDTRTACTSQAQCAAGQTCMAGRCSDPCTDNTECTDGLTCFSVDSQRLCLPSCTDFSATGTDCAPDTHCIPYFGTSGGLCQGTGRKHQGENCLPDGDPDSCQPGHTCVGLGNQRTCQQLCAGEGSPTCSGNAFCEPAFLGPDDNALTDDAGACLADCKNTAGLPDNSLCPPEHTCVNSSYTDKSFCVADNGGGLDAPCSFNDTDNGCAIGLGCLAGGHGATIGEPETGVCTNTCKLDQNPTGCTDGYTCIQRSNGDTPQDGVCVKSCDPHKPSATNGCPDGRNRCMPETDHAVPPVAGICSPSGSLLPGQSCALAHPMACGGDHYCATMNTTQGGSGDDGATHGICTTFCAPFDYTNATRCPAEQVCAIKSFGDALGFCTTYRTTNGQNSGDRCDATTENHGKWCGDNLLCDYWNGQFLSCEIPCFTDVPNRCPAGKSCDSINAPNAPTLGYCR